MALCWGRAVGGGGGSHRVGVANHLIIKYMVVRQANVKSTLYMNLVFCKAYILYSELFSGNFETEQNYPRSQSRLFCKHVEEYVITTFNEIVTVMEIMVSLRVMHSFLRI